MPSLEAAASGAVIVGRSDSGRVRFRDLPEFEVFWPVVGSTPVLVMDPFVSFQEASQHLLHDESVFWDVTIGVGVRVGFDEDFAVARSGQGVATLGASSVTGDVEGWVSGVPMLCDTGGSSGGCWLSAATEADAGSRLGRRGSVQGRLASSIVSDEVAPPRKGEVATAALARGWGRSWFPWVVTKDERVAWLRQCATFTGALLGNADGATAGLASSVVPSGPGAPWLDLNAASAFTCRSHYPSTLTGAS